MPGAISISIKAASAPVETRPHIIAEVKALTDEDLAMYWQEAGERLEISGLLSEGVPHVGDHPGQIEIDAQSVGFVDEFKPHRIEVMEFLREKTGMRMLDCKVNPRFVEKTEVIYSPDDKYSAMLEKNPDIAELRKLFPLIDY